MRRLLLAALLCLACAPAWAAVAFDAKGTAACDGTSGTSTVTVSCSTLTIGASLSNSVLVAVASTSHANGTTTITATWNSVSMGAAIGTSYAPSAGVVIFCLKAPASGLHALSMTMTTASGGTELHIIGASFQGVDQTTPCKNYNGVVNPASTATITVPVTSAVGDMVVGVFENGSTGAGSNPNLSGTPITTYGNDFSGPNISLEANRDSGAATVNLTDTGGGAVADWVGAGIDLAAAGGGAATIHSLMMMGVGQ